MHQFPIHLQKHLQIHLQTREIDERLTAKERHVNNMTIEDEILQYLHYHPLSNRVEITLGITNPPSGRIVKRLLADAITKGMIEVL